MSIKTVIKDLKSTKNIIFGENNEMPFTVWFSNLL